MDKSLAHELQVQLAHGLLMPSALAALSAASVVAPRVALLGGLMHVLVAWVSKML